MDTDDLYPTELELIYSSLTVLMCEEKDVEKRIAVNNDDIKNRVKDIVIPMYDVSACPISDVEHQHQHQHQNFEPETTSDPEPSAQHTSHQDSEHTSTSESIPIVKKLFKQIALLCHPDKVKDEKHGRLFIHARSAHDKNDVLMLLFILSRCSAIVVLKEEETVEVKEIIEKRQQAILKKN
jgi:hypothetical protein